jgi:peptide/nickel transport system substrate-binding protein
VINLRAMAGEYDFQARHIDLQKLPVLLQNQERGGYKVFMDPGENGGDFCIRINLAYEADGEIGDWLRSTEFRRALSLGIDREQLNETFWLGTGVPGSVVPADHNKYNPGPEYRARWSTHDPAQANALLDDLGLSRRDAEGFRMRKDGADRLRIDYTVAAGTTPDWARMGEMLREQWKRIGVELNVKAIEGTLLTVKAVANELQISGSSNSGSEDLFVTPDLVFPFITNNYQGMLGIPYAQWFHSGGTAGKEPPPRVREVMELWRNGLGAPEAERIEIGKQIWRINADEVFQIGIIATGPAVYGVRIAKTSLRNVPARVINATTVKSPGNALPQTFFSK